MKIRNILALILVLALLLTVFTACSKKETTVEEPEVAQSEPEQPAEPEPTVANLGETYTVDGVCSFTITGYELVPEITRNGMILVYGSYFKTDESSTLLLVKAKYTNLGTEEIDWSDLVNKAQLVYQDTYTYEGKSASWDNAIPLSEIEAYFVFNIPKTVAQSGEPLVTTLTFGEETFTHTVQLS